MSDDRIDFSALDPTQDAVRFDHVVAGITKAAAPALAMRRQPHSTLEVIAGWRRPLLAAAAVVVILGGAVLAWVSEGPVMPRRLVALGEALGVPSTVASWVVSDQVPEPGQILTMFAEGR